jgi:predicted O-methyltransferase YrrM
MIIDFNKAKYYTDKLEKIVGYGTEDFSIFLYSLIKMRKPATIVELGTGVGSVMIWAGLACKENNFGKIITIDNGLHWDQDIKHRNDEFLFQKNYSDFIEYLIKDNEIENFVIFKKEDIEINKINNLSDIDILFVDFDHNPLTIHKIVESCMSRMSSESIIFFDSASTYFPSYLFLEKIINEFNKNIIASSFNFDDKTKNFILNSNFTLSHIIENKNRIQNSTAMIEIKPEDCFPNSKTIRF